MGDEQYKPWAASVHETVVRSAAAGTYKLIEGRLGPASTRHDGSRPFPRRSGRSMPAIKRTEDPA